MTSAVVDASNASWDDEVLHGNKLVMVLFWAEWCAPCVTMLPIIEELAQAHAEKLKVVRLDIDRCDAIAGRYKVSIVPTITFFKNRQKLHEAIGIVPKAALEASILALQG